ncbi:hypothetical protein [Halobacillus sp. BBL2006]|uniref:hypothetical protein n=1 Tax=Halobacillus sp. BBL2006 TaxID=1543706 RepID=UPI0005434BF7|nr:hypothetical protein [Halobacillus sp. BBL2006]KHE69668.1 hypothetical protein LD39_12590 [Halobacillus sp. BBL2006]
MLKRDVLNKILLLHIMETSSKKNIKGSTRLQKMVFASESQARKKGTNAFNYDFIRWYYGPYSEELSSDIEVLISKGLIKRDNQNNYTLTPSGKGTLEKAKKILPKVADLDVLQNIVDDYSEKKLKVLLKEVYNDYNVTSYNMGEVIEPLKYSEASESPNV